MVSMATRWNQLSKQTRGWVVVGGVLDVGLRIAALVDLSRRPASQIRGRKAVWATALGVVNSAGVLPMAYFAVGRNGTSPR